MSIPLAYEPPSDSRAILFFERLVRFSFFVFLTLVPAEVDGEGADRSGDAQRFGFSGLGLAGLNLS